MVRKKGAITNRDGDGRTVPYSHLSLAIKDGIYLSCPLTSRSQYLSRLGL